MISRKKFIQSLLGITGLSFALEACNTKPPIKGKIEGAASSIGHLLRDKQFGKPDKMITKKVVIIGGGMPLLYFRINLFPFYSCFVMLPRY